MRRHVIAIRFALCLAALLAAGCSGKSVCSKACDKLAECQGIDKATRQAGEWTCPYDASCDEKAACPSQCVIEASCAAILGQPALDRDSFVACQRDCSSQPGDDLGPGGDGSSGLDSGPYHDAPVVPLDFGENYDCTVTPCPKGYFCDLNSKKCQMGCIDSTGCGENESCDLPTNSCVCNEGFHRCQGSCIPVNSTSGCGPSCAVCPGDPHGTAVCVAGTCSVSCDAGHLWCGGTCLPCSDPHGSPTCQQGKCSFTCDGGYHLCGAACFADDDATHCGKSCTSCPAPSGANMQAVCTQGTCSVSCLPGYVPCKGSCATKGSCSWTSVQIPSSAGLTPLLALDLSPDGTIHLGYGSLHYTAFKPPAAPPATPLFSMSCASPKYNSLVLSAGSPRAELVCVKSMSYGSNTLSVTLRSWDASAQKWTYKTLSTFDNMYDVDYVTKHADQLVWGRWKTIYNSPGTNTFNFAEKVAGSWKVSTLTTLTQNSKPVWLLPGLRVAYVDSSNASSAVLKLGQRSGTSWSFVNQSQAPIRGIYRLDASNSLQVVHLEYPSVDLTYRAQASGWQPEVVQANLASNYLVRSYGFILVQGLPMVAFHHNGSLWLATRIDGTWHKELIAAFGTGSTVAVTLATLPGKTPVVAAMDSTGAQAFY